MPKLIGYTTLIFSCKGEEPKEACEKLAAEVVRMAEEYEMECLGGVQVQAYPGDPGEVIWVVVQSMVQRVYTSKLEYYNQREMR